MGDRVDRKAAKELLHIQGWLDRVEEIVDRGKKPTLAMTCSKRLATRS